MRSCRSFSHGVDYVLAKLRPYGRAKTGFPGTDINTRWSHRQETLHSWFVRMVNEHCAGDVARLKVEDNIALLASLCWEQGVLRYANITVLVAEGRTLGEFYNRRPATSATYLRLDLDYRSLGDLFSHPLVHVHVGGTEGPRFSLDGGNRGNMVVDFIEFIYRNYAWNKWSDWALESLRSPQDIATLKRIMTASREGQFEILRSHASDLERIKQTLNEAKDEMFPAHMNGADRRILEYPLAR